MCCSLCGSHGVWASQWCGVQWILAAACAAGPVGAGAFTRPWRATFRANVRDVARGVCPVGVGACLMAHPLGWEVCVLVEVEVWRVCMFVAWKFCLASVLCRAHEAAGLMRARLMVAPCTGWALGCACGQFCALHLQVMFRLQRKKERITQVGVGCPAPALRRAALPTSRRRLSW